MRFFNLKIKMSTISPTLQIGRGMKKNSQSEYLVNMASVISSRESTIRTVLDVAAFDLPTMLADSFRGVKKLAEISFETLTGSLSIFIAPIITKHVGILLGNSILPSSMKKDALNYLRFNMTELDSVESLQEGVSRIKEEEVEDRNFVSDLFLRLSKKEQSKQYKNEAKEIEQFCNAFEANKENLELVSKLKRSTILLQSSIEGAWWGGMGFVVRAFRKHVLKADRFTGTMNYVNDDESKQLGEADGLSKLQIFGGGFFMFLTPMLNLFLINKTKDPKKIENSPFYKTARSQIDMTHGVFPKLGLLATMTVIPKWLGILVTAQGRNERIERFTKICTIIPSWWLGQRLTNGVLAKRADKKLVEEFSDVKPGILVEPELLEPIKSSDSLLEKIDKCLPDQAKINHVMSSTRGNEELQQKAEREHARCLYVGMALHSAFVWVINMVINQMTKLRAEHALGKV